MINKLPCGECIVQSMCTRSCDTLVTYLEEYFNSFVDKRNYTKESYVLMSNHIVNKEIKLDPKDPKGWNWTIDYEGD